MTEPGWISLKCSWCQTRFRIKEAYAHLKGKCPECGTRVPPVKHKPYEPLPALSEADEPAGLVPMDDDEWPEPALREREEVEAVQYAVSSAPPTSMPPAVSHAPGEVFALAAEPSLPSAAATAPVLIPPAPAAPLMSKKAEARVPPAPVPPPAPKPQDLDPLFLDDTTAFGPAPAPAPISITAPEPAAPPMTAPMEDVFAKAEAQLAPKDPDGPLITPYGFSDGPPPVPMPEPPASTPPQPPLAQFAPPAAAPAAPTEASTPVKPKRKKEKPPPSTAGDDPQASSDQTTEDKHAYRLSMSEVNPERAVPPPDKLFLFGVWDWPFRPHGLKAWLCIAAGAALFLCFLHQALVQFAVKSPLSFVFGSAMSFLCAIVVGVFGAYASAWFLAILSDTANGSRSVDWPGGGIVDWVGALLRILWILLLAGLIAMTLGVVNFFWLGAFGWGLGVLLIFPVFLLCSLASDWSWSPWHPEVALHIAQKFKLLFTMYFLSAFLFGLVGLVLWLTMGEIWLSPIGGLAIAAAWLIYARLLGRFGWVVLHPDEDPTRKKKKKKRKKAAENENDPATADDTADSLVATPKP